MIPNQSRNAAKTKKPITITLTLFIYPPSRRHGRRYPLMISVVGSVPHPQTEWSARYKRRRLLPAERRGRRRPIEPISASNGGRGLSPVMTVPATPQHAKESYFLPPLQVAECVVHILKGNGVERLFRIRDAHGKGQAVFSSLFPFLRHYAIF